MHLSRGKTMESEAAHTLMYNSTSLCSETLITSRFIANMMMIKGFWTKLPSSVTFLGWMTDSGHWQIMADLGWPNSWRRNTSHRLLHSAQEYGTQRTLYQHRHLMN